MARRLLTDRCLLRVDPCSEIDAEKLRRRSELEPLVGAPVEPRQRARRVQVVVEARPAPRPGPGRRRRRPAEARQRTRRSAAVTRSPSRPLPVRRGSGGRAGPAGWPPAPTPSGGRPRRPGCRGTWTSWCRPSPTRPTWSQCRTNGWPVTASDWAVSHSWWGKTRSRPPPWRSMVSPSSRRASAEHSMCQPGPARAPAGLPGRLVGQRRLPQHEVERVALVRVVGLAAVLGRQLQHGRRLEVADLAEARRRSTRRSTPRRPTGRRGPRSRAAPMSDRMSEMAEVARGSDHGQEAEGRHVGVEAGHLLGRQVEVVDAELAGLAQDVVVDVGDVAHAAGLVAQVAQAALEDVEGQVDGGVAQVGGVVGGDPAGVHGDHGPRARRARPPPGRCRRGASVVGLRCRPAAACCGPCSGCSA